MENKSDVKAIMARFQASGASTDETSPAPGRRPKQPLQPTLSSGSAAQKKPVFETLSSSGVNVAPKANFLKNTVSSKSDTDAQELNKTKALANRFANIQGDTNNKPFIGNKPLKPELKPPVQKPPFNKTSLASTTSESKPVVPKPSLVTASKPSWVKEDSGGGAASTAGFTPPKVPSAQHKPISSIGKLKVQNDDVSGSVDTVNKSPPAINSLKPPSNVKTAQNMFNKAKPEQTDSGGSNKSQLVVTNSTPPPKPHPSKKPSLKKPSPVSSHTSNINGNAAAGQKRNPLPNTLALGPAPAKPNRPPNVNLESFRRRAEPSNEGPGFRKTSALAATTMSQPTIPAVPSLPPRHPGTMNQQQQEDDFYDDVEELTSSPPPPPLPSSAGHPSQRAKEEHGDDDDGEMYEDLDERWEAAEQKQDKKKEKAEKEEKKRQEKEQKEQKEREKREQDARKKFKLVGPLEVIHQGKARTDYKGSKTDLALKQGDCLDIIRVQGNPEGKWLGRTADGSIGYVKTTSVEIDFNTLKNHQAQPSYEPEIYDDIDVGSSGNGGVSGPGVILPPPPGDEGEIYDDCVDPNLEVRVPPPSQFTADSISDQLGGAIDEEIYDDVDSQGAPPPPPISSLPGMKGKGRIDEMDPKKQKKFEKEEKEFRKKFKYDGEIHTLYQVTTIHSLTNKKWGFKDLSIKAGEKLDVIVKAVDNKLICRNEDGKFGYVSTSHIAVDDGEIYDDIGDDCIYDND